MSAVRFTGMSVISALTLLGLLLCTRSDAAPSASVTTANPTPAAIRLVLIVSRHGVRSPTDPTEMTPYSARPWPTWSVPPGNLTLHGAHLMTLFGAAYRSFYARQGIFPASGCPSVGAVYVWSDVDQRTRATGTALIKGLAPGCGISSHASSAKADPLFDAVPLLAKANSATSSAALMGAIGDSPGAIVPANRSAFAELDSLLGCRVARCKTVSDLPSSVDLDPDTGEYSLGGPIDVGSTAVDNLLLAYADGKPRNQVGWGRVDGRVLLELSRLDALEVGINETPYATRIEGSNLLSHIAATLDQAATGRRNASTRVPLVSRFVAIVGHSGSLESLAGILRLGWLMPGYQRNATPPGGALVFEVWQPNSAQSPPFVRLFFTAQTLDQMRTASPAQPQRVPVFVPGCPSLDCPVATFDSIVTSAIDSRFVGTW